MNDGIRTPRTREEIDFLLEDVFKSKGWETIKHGIGWLVTIKIENEENPYQIIIQNMEEYVSLSIVLCSDGDAETIKFLKDIAEKLNVKLPAKDSTYVPSRISIINDGYLHRLVSIQAFETQNISNLDFSLCLITAINNLISIYSLFGASLPALADALKKADESTSYSKTSQQESNGCYIATAVYGSYDCPEVWTLRRYRDYTLAETWYGKVFIKIYYAISPTIVKWLGNTAWFNRFWKVKLDHMISVLQEKGIESTPYQDKKW